MKAKSIAIFMGLALMLAGGINNQCTAQTTVASVALLDYRTDASATEIFYLLDDPATTGVEDPDPIKLLLTLENRGDIDVLTSAGFSSKPFHLLLTFIDPEGRAIRANQLRDSFQGDPETPLTLPVDGALIAAEPIETLAGGTSHWLLEVTVPDAHSFYSLAKAGRYSAQLIVPMKTYPAVDHTVGGVNYAELAKVSWNGVLESIPVAFSLVADADGDGYSYPLAYGAYSVADCDDNNPAVNPGATEIANNGLDDDCNPATVDGAAMPKGSVLIKAEKHTVGSGSYPGSSKEPIVGLPLKVLDKSPYSCVSKYGVSWQHYQSVYLYCPAVSSGFTGDQGTAVLTAAPGNYLLVGQYDPDKSISGDELYIGVSVGELEADETIQKYLQVIAKADGKKVPAKYTQKTGSELLIIEPEYVEWTCSQELYPFIFESLGDWGVTTAIMPPEGFVADYDNLSTDINSELKAVQFTVTDIGSKWVDTQVEYTLKHKGRTEKVRSKIGVVKNKKKKKDK